MKNIRLNYHYLLIIFFCFLIVTPVSAQVYLLRSKKAVTRLFNQHGKENKLNTVVNVSDSLLQLQVRDTAFRKLNFSCYFNAKDRCYKQTKTTDCAECFDKYLNEVMNMRRYGWKKISDNLYVSKPFWSTVLIIDPDVPFSFSMLHEYWAGEEQKKIYNKAN